MYDQASQPPAPDGRTGAGEQYTVRILSSSGVGPRGRPWGGCAYACRRVRGADERVMVRGGWRRASGLDRPGRLARRWRGGAVGRRPRCGRMPVAVMRSGTEEPSGGACRSADNRAVSGS